MKENKTIEIKLLKKDAEVYSVLLSEGIFFLLGYLENCQNKENYIYKRLKLISKNLLKLRREINAKL